MSINPNLEEDNILSYEELQALQANMNAAAKSTQQLQLAYQQKRKDEKLSSPKGWIDKIINFLLY